MPSPSFFGLMAIVFGMLYELWPASLLFSLIWPGNRLRNLLVVWGFWVLVRLLLLAYPAAYTPAYDLIAEPVCTRLLLAAGPLLGAAWLLWEHVWQSRRQAPQRSRVSRPGREVDAHRTSGQAR